MYQDRRQQGSTNARPGQSLSGTRSCLLNQSILEQSNGGQLYRASLLTCVAHQNPHSFNSVSCCTGQALIITTRAGVASPTGRDIPLKPLYLDRQQQDSINARAGQLSLS